MKLYAAKRERFALFRIDTDLVRTAADCRLIVGRAVRSPLALLRLG